MRRPVSWLKRISTMALLCSSSNSKRCSKLRCASVGVLLARIMCTTSSMLSQAMIRPSKMWARSCAFFKSYFVRRMVTSCRCSTKYFTQSFRLNSRGRPFTKAIQFTENELCSAVILNNLFRMTFALASRFTSITMRIPCRPDSSLALLIPSIFPSFTNSAMYSISACLFTPYGISVMTILSWFSPLSISAFARITMRPRPVS